MTSPHTPNLFKVQEAEKLAREDQEKFHSTVMRIMFYAVRVRPDILCTANYLSTRTRLGVATTDDQERLIRLVQYIESTLSDGITLGGGTNNNLRIVAYADASYGFHMDGTSHTGLVISLGRSPIYVKSGEQNVLRNRAA